MSACSSGSERNKPVEGIHINLLKFDLRTLNFGKFGPPETIQVSTKPGHPVEEVSWDAFVNKQRCLMEDEKRGHKRNRGWFIVLCSFIINVLILGFFKSMGILIIEFRSDLQASAADVALIVSVTYCLNSIAGPLACYMVVKYTPRSVALTGAVMVCLGMMLSWWATSVLQMCITVGVLGGFGSGLTYSPGLILVGLYFEKYRGIANGIVVSGSPVGGMIMPYLLSYLADYFTSRDTLFIIGALLMNACVCTLSFRNPRQLRKVQKDESSTVSVDKKRKHPPKLIGAGATGKKWEVKTTASISNLRSSSLVKARTVDRNINTSSVHQIFHRKPGQKKKTRKKSPPPDYTVNADLHLGSKAILGEKAWFIPKRYSQESNSLSQQRVELEESTIISDSMQSSAIRNRSKVKINVSPISCSGSSYTSKIHHSGSKEEAQYVLALDHSCMILLPQEHMRQGGSKNLSKTVVEPVTSTTHSTSSCTNQPTKDSNENSRYLAQSSSNKEDEKNGKKVSKKNSSGCCSSFCKDNKYFSAASIKSLLRDRMYMILLFANATPAIATTNVFLLAPSFGEYLGMGRDDFSTICLMISLMDLIGRLLGTFLSDKGIMRSKTVYAFGLFVAGVSSLFLGVCNDFYCVIAICSFFGVGSGFHIGIMGVLLQEIVGIEMLPAGYALSMFLNGILVLIGPYFCGYLLSAYPGCYLPMFTVFGIILMAGASLWLIPFCLNKRKRQNENEVAENESELSSLCGGLSMLRSQSVGDAEVLPEKKLC